MLSQKKKKRLKRKTSSCDFFKQQQAALFSQPVCCKVLENSRLNPFRLLKSIGFPQASYSRCHRALLTVSSFKQRCFLAPEIGLLFAKNIVLHNFWCRYPQPHGLQQPKEWKTPLGQSTVYLHVAGANLSLTLI